MARKDSYNDHENDRERGRGDWLLFLILLLLGFGCMLGAAQMAVRPDSLWRVSADMLSELNPDEVGEVGRVQIGPLRPEVMTPPWDPSDILTPIGTLVVAPTVVLGPPPTSTPTPQGVAGASPTPSSSPTALTPSPTPTPTLTGTPTPTPTPTPTGTPTPTPTPTTTSTPTSTSTPTATPTPTPPPPPPPTNTPVPPPPTNTPTPTPTALPPIVQAITPDTRVNTGAVDVTIAGQNFQTGCSAALDGVPLTVSSCAPTTIQASVPLDIVAGYYDLTVTNPDSQSGGLTSAYTATNPIPVITAVEPMTWFNTIDVTVTITGANFRNTGAPGGLRAGLDGPSPSALAVTYVSATTLRAAVPSNSAGMSLGAYTITVTNPGPTDPTGSLANGFVLDTYTTTATCSGAVIGTCSDAEGPPDDVFVAITGTGTITLDFGIGQGITHGPGYDMVFYERSNPPGIWLDYIRIELSADGTTWYTVFEWDGDNPGDVTGTSIDSYATDGDGEAENEQIPSSDLYPFPGAGIAIDIAAVPSPPPAGNYYLVRFTSPGGSEPSEIDALQSLH